MALDDGVVGAIVKGIFSMFVLPCGRIFLHKRFQLLRCIESKDRFGVHALMRRAKRKRFEQHAGVMMLGEFNALAQVNIAAI